MIHDETFEQNIQTLEQEIREIQERIRESNLGTEKLILQAELHKIYILIGRMRYETNSEGQANHK